jgi:hypothetical protein
MADLWRRHPLLLHPYVLLARELFGAETIRQMPTTPIYWMLSLRKPRLVDEAIAEMFRGSASPQPAPATAGCAPHVPTPAEA